MWVRVSCILAPASANVHAAQLDKGRERELSNMAAVYDGRVGDKQSQVKSSSTIETPPPECKTSLPSVCEKIDFIDFRYKTFQNL